MEKNCFSRNGTLLAASMPVSALETRPQAGAGVPAGTASRVFDLIYVIKSKLPYFTALN